MDEEEEPDLDFIEWKKMVLGEFENAAQRAHLSKKSEQENLSKSADSDTMNGGRSKVGKVTVLEEKIGGEATVNLRERMANQSG